ncbi:MAG: hypothetical protein K8I27_13980 [Planctomycetes bacterium]|nr:hypothetical protein [Planctomycetota bacterium]
MSQGDAPRDIREILAGRPGAANRFLRRFGKPILDYATALIPDRSEPFDRMVEDILVDAIAQSRTAARLKEDEQVFEYVMEVALRTVRARYRHVLDAEARPSKATTSYNFKEVLEKTRMTEAELTAGISEGKYRAVRDNDQMKIKGDSIPGLGERKSYHGYSVSAAERELLCLHYRLHFSPETIARWSGSVPAQVEAIIGKAANRLTEAIARKRGGRGPEVKDTEMRRYIDGRMVGDETAKFERSVLKDKIAQQRLDELRSQSDSIRELFDSGPYELSSIAVNVRARNPHHALALPPVAALWLQVVGLAALMLMFHNVGGYIAPPDVRLTAAVGDVNLPPIITRAGEQPDVLVSGESRVFSLGDWVETSDASQALLVLDNSNRVLLAPGGKLHLLEPRPDARQVLLLEKGEVWGRFTASGHAFAMSFGAPENPGGELASDVGAEFDLAIEPGAGLLPDNLAGQLTRALQVAVELDENGGLRVTRPIHAFAGYRFGGTDAGLLAGDVIESAQGVSLEQPADLAAIAGGMAPGDAVPLSVRRDGERLALSLLRTDKQPWAVVRVFHGALVAGAPGSERLLVNAGQWAVFYADEPPLIGLRGMEDFRVLRIDANERFKQRLHWLNTGHYPLRAEHSVLSVERELRALASELEQMRADKIQRSGEREIAQFDAIMRAAIADAKSRIAREEGRDKSPGLESLSDSALVAAEDEILSIIANWRRRGTSGIYPTLGSAAKTLSASILRDEAELEARGSELTESLLRQDEISKLDGAIERLAAAIATLKASDFHDASGDKRADLDARISVLDKHVREGANARGRKDLVLVKLNDLDAKIDDQRRKVAGLTQQVTDAQAALDETAGLLAANIYTPQKLQDAEAAVGYAETALDAARIAVAGANDGLQVKDDLLRKAKLALARTEALVESSSATREAAADTLTDAVAARAAAQSAVEEAQVEVDRIQAEFDALPEGDPARESKQIELTAAQEALSAKQRALDEAVKSADDANKALKTAESVLAGAETDAAAALKAENEAQAAMDAADAAHQDATKRETDASGALDAAKATLKAQQDAKAARALLDTRLNEQREALNAASASLDTVNGKINDLETQAAPEREKLTTELALITKGEESAEAIKELHTERGRYQGVSDEIALHGKDAAALEEQRQALADSDLVKNFERLQTEYQALSARIDAFKFTRARALLEDSSFAYAQDAAQHAFKEAAAEAEARAVEVLQRYCPDYDHDGYGDLFSGEEGDALRLAVLGALWKLYYDAGLHGSDDGEKICYYVAVQSGAGANTLEALDNRWQAYLSSAFGNDGFEALGKLEPVHLAGAGR